MRIDKFITPEAYRAETHGPSSRGHLTIIPCRSGRRMAEGVCQAYNALLQGKGSTCRISLCEAQLGTFPDTEIQVEDICETVRGKDVFIVQQINDPTSGRSVNDNYLELLFLADACRRHSAKNITAVIPYPAYSRQDKIDFGKRQPISSAVLAQITAVAGFNHVLTCTLHAQQIKGYYPIPVDELDMLKTWVDYFADFRGKDDVIIVACDAGSAKTTQLFARFMGISSAFASKSRKSASDVEALSVVGDFRGKRRAIIIDDVMSTAGTVAAIAKDLYIKGYYKELYVAVTHAVLSPPAMERLQFLNTSCGLQKFVFTNTIPQREEVLALPFVEQLPLERDLALSINRIHYENSLREAFVDPLGKEKQARLQ